jgi:hypothetical protein
MLGKGLLSRRRFISAAVGGLTGFIGPSHAGNPIMSESGNSDSPDHREMNPRLFTFVGGDSGPWVVQRVDPVVGASMSPVSRLSVANGGVPELPRGAVWALRGVTSNVRYTTRAEVATLSARQVAPGRPDATHAALIPIKKTAAWWDLPIDERRKIFEESSHHIALGSKYLPMIARRLHHCRDLALPEPFDFLTWFDYPSQAAESFEKLVAELRATEEWKYVEREVDIRLTRE